MNKEWKQKWVEALRSGKYEQGQGTLKSNNKYCCLGVLYDISEEPWNDGGFNSYTKENTSGHLGRGFSASVGLNFSQQYKLSSMNDNGKTFSEIADYIEKEL